MNIKGSADFEDSIDTPEMASRPRYLLVDANAKRAEEFRKHFARFIRAALLDVNRVGETNQYEPPRGIDDYQKVFIGKNSLLSFQAAYPKFKGEITAIDDFRDCDDWLACAFYGEKNGCMKINPLSSVEEVIEGLKAEIVKLKKKLACKVKRGKK